MYNSSDTTNGSTISYAYPNCPYKLPCGYCTKLYMDCPKQGNSTATPYLGPLPITYTGEKDNG